MPLADARARVPDLAIVPHDPVLDHAWLDRLAQGCARYTPLVALDAPDGLILDITGCSHLFEGEAGLIDDIDRRLTRLGMTLRPALGPTADAARALARYQTRPAPDEASAIRRLPVAALELEAEAATALVRAGLKTIGDLAARPTANIAARFGADAATALRRLLGDAPSPLDPRTTPPPVVAERRFAEPVASMPHATQILTELVGEAIADLGERGKGGRHFRATFFRSDGLARSIAVETGHPTRDNGLVMRLFAERMDALRDPLDPGFGFDMMRLAVPRLEALAATQLKLEGGAVRAATEGAAMAELVDRLATRIGRGGVRKFVAADTHIPEQAQLALPAALVECLLVQGALPVAEIIALVWRLGRDYRGGSLLARPSAGRRYADHPPSRPTGDDRPCRHDPRTSRCQHRRHAGRAALPGRRGNYGAQR